MKKIMMILFINMAFALDVNAQYYKKIKVGLGLGVAFPGLLCALEPAYRVNDDLAIGLRIEGAVVLIEGGNLQYYGSFTLNSQYYLSDRRYRWFVGAGLGLYNVSGDFIHSVKPEFGIYPRVGFDIGHRYLLLDYNIISAPQETGTLLTGYLGLRVGFYFGGGKKVSEY